MKYLSENKINPIDFLKDAHHEEAGAVVLFSGEARTSPNKEVDYLFYEAHIELAERMIHAIVEKAIEKFNLKFATCVHRIGEVGICESAVVVVTLAKHRKEAYAANQYIIHEVKHEAPIWKKEVYTDGTFEWGTNCSCSTS
jgi:molybdopterin synthase catalytic subunit